MEEYKSNSHASKNKETVEKKDVKPVVNGGVKTKKKSELRKFADVFISEDVENVKNYIFNEVLIPGIKDLAINTLSMMLWGEAGRGRRSNSNGSRMSYQNYYNKGKSERRENNSARTRFDYNDIIFETRGDAELVLSELDELMDSYEMVSIQDLYSAAGLDCPYTYNNYGWTNIRSAAVIRVNDGYMIKLPKAKPL